MPAIQRNITRVVLESTEITSSTSVPGVTTAALELTTSQALYVGYKLPFACRHFQMGTVNSNSATLTVTYWNGSAWADVEDLLDQTNGMTSSGFISWVNPSGELWKKKALTPIDDVELYWVRIVTGANFSSGTTLQSVLNLFCDDSLLRQYYPELVNDARYKPSGRTDWTEQYHAAKDLVVDQLKKDDLIREEAEVLDPNEVCVAAVHATAWVIYNPITRDEEGREFVKGLWDEFRNSLKGTKLDLDYDNSGKIEDDEENTGNFFKARV